MRKIETEVSTLIIINQPVAEYAFIELSQYGLSPRGISHRPRAGLSLRLRSFVVFSVKSLKHSIDFDHTSPHLILYPGDFFRSPTRRTTGVTSRSFHLLYFSLDVASEGFDAGVLSGKLFQVIAQIASSYQVSSLSIQPKPSAEEPSLKAVSSIPNPVVALVGGSELPKIHAKVSRFSLPVCTPLENLLILCSITFLFGGDGNDGCQRCSDVCAICLNDMAEGDATHLRDCRHKFHAGCIEEWRSNQARNGREFFFTVPLCSTFSSYVQLCCILVVMENSAPQNAEFVIGLWMTDILKNCGLVETRFIQGVFDCGAGIIHPSGIPLRRNGAVHACGGLCPKSEFAPSLILPNSCSLLFSSPYIYFFIFVRISIFSARPTSGMLKLPTVCSFLFYF
ncbi:ring finger domain protein [Puccinia sorghi]|uniref:Ring finger domain protein n=1 Tax=Puccinia sorghi TaxID=27349 RepID=A0A0L6URW7_9BASI|nr:ring finger domain protein [Puccinia sorghi]